MDYLTENICEDADPSYQWIPRVDSHDAIKVAKFSSGFETDWNDCQLHWRFMKADQSPSGVSDWDYNYDECPDENGGFEIPYSESDYTFPTIYGVRIGDVSGNWSAPLDRQNDNLWAGCIRQ